MDSERCSGMKSHPHTSAMLRNVTRATTRVCETLRLMLDSSLLSCTGAGRRATYVITRNDRFA